MSDVTPKEFVQAFIEVYGERVSIRMLELNVDAADCPHHARKRKRLDGFLVDQCSRCNGERLVLDHPNKVEDD